MHKEENMREITYAQAIKEAMCEEMRWDEDVFLMGETSGYTAALLAYP